MIPGVDKEPVEHAHGNLHTEELHSIGGEVQIMSQNFLLRGLFI